MPRHRFAVTIVAAASLTGLLGACGGADDDGADEPATTAPATGATTAPGAIEVIAGAPDAADAAACGASREALELTVETYVALNGEPPSSQTDLVDAQLIREASPLFEIGTDGALVPAPGSPCP